MLKLSILLGSLFLILPSLAQDETGWLVVGDKVYGLLPPQVVSDGVKESLWSPCGRYILIRRHIVELNQKVIERLLGEEPIPPAKHESLLIWDVEAGKGREVWDSRRTPGEVSLWRAGWIGRTGAVLYLVERRRDGGASRAFRATGATGAVEELRYTIPDSSGPVTTHVITSAEEPYALIGAVGYRDPPRPNQVLHICYASGPLSRPFEPPASAAFMGGVKGTKSLYAHSAVSANSTGGLVVETYRFDPRTLQFSQVMSRAEIEFVTSDVPIWLETLALNLPATSIERNNPSILWLVGGDGRTEVSRIVVTTDSDVHELSPGGAECSSSAGVQLRCGASSWSSSRITRRREPKPSEQPCCPGRATLPPPRICTLQIPTASSRTHLPGILSLRPT